MKKSILLTGIVFIAVCVHAQRPYVPTPADLAHLKTTKTYVVLEASPMSDFNFEIKEAMPKEWDLTPFDFINEKDFDEKSKDANATFIYTSNVTFDRDKTESEYIYLHLSLGGDNKSLNDLRDIISIPLGYTSADPDNYNYKIGLIIRFMQKHVNMLLNNPELISSNMFNHYNKNMSDIKAKTLYIVEDELAKEVNSEARVRQVYPHKFKIATRDEIKAAIDRKDENIVFLHKVGPEGKKLKARCYKILIGAGDANFYYYDHHMITPKNQDGFLLLDFKKIAR